MIPSVRYKLNATQAERIEPQCSDNFSITQDNFSADSVLCPEGTRANSPRFQSGETETSHQSSPEGTMSPFPRGRLGNFERTMANSATTNLWDHRATSTYTSRTYHTVFSTKYRKRRIDESFKEDLYSYIGGIIRGEKGNPLEIGGHMKRCPVRMALSVLNYVCRLI